MLATFVGIALLQPGGSLFTRAVPNPTGRNGYEEYVRAAEIVSNPEASTVLRWSPNTVAEKRTDLAQAERFLREAKDEGMRQEWSNAVRDGRAALAAAEALARNTPLEVDRIAVQRFGGVMDLLERGNRKPVEFPRALGLTTLLPELAAFRMVTMAGLAAVRVAMAEGNGSTAVRHLETLLWFTHRTRSFTTIHYLVSIVDQRRILRQMLELLPALPERPLAGLIAALSRILDDGTALAQIFRVEATYLDEALSLVAKDPRMLAGFASDADPILSRVARMGEGQRNALLEEARGVLRRSHEEWLRRLERPESAWFDPIPEPTGSPEAIALAKAVGENPRLLGYEAVRNTQLRIARASLRVVQYRWHHRHLPARLDDAVPDVERADPISEQALQYQASGGSFRVFSKGHASTGEIDLGSQVSVGSSGRDIAPPPLQPALR